MSNLQKNYLKNCAIVIGVFAYIFFIIFSIKMMGETQVFVVLAFIPIVYMFIYIIFTSILELIAYIINGWRIRGVLNEKEWDIYNEYYFSAINRTNTAPAYQSEEQMLKTLSFWHDKNEIEKAMQVYYKIHNNTKLLKQYIICD